MDKKEFREKIEAVKIKMEEEAEVDARAKAEAQRILEATAAEHHPLTYKFFETPLENI